MAAPPAGERLRAIARRWPPPDAAAVGVAAALAPLVDDGWRITHGIVIGSRGRIDHVAIGDAGVFAVSSHVPSFVAARLDPLALDSARAQAQLLARVTGADVTPLVALSRGRERILRERGVAVLPARLLAGHLRALPPVLCADRVDELALLLHAAVGAHAATA